MSAPETVHDLIPYGLTTRMLNCLCRENIMTVAQLTSRTREDLMDIRQVGISGVENVVATLKRVRKTLADDKPPSSVTEVLFSGPGVTLTSAFGLHLDVHARGVVKPQPNTAKGRRDMADAIGRLVSSLFKAQKFLELDYPMPEDDGS